MKLENLRTLDIPLTVYLVVNRDGQFFRAKGYGGYGKSWVEDVKKAKVYTKIGPARSCVTFYSKWQDEFGIPDILQFDLVNGVILDETARVLKAVKKIEEVKINSEIRSRQYQKERLEREIEQAKNKLKSLNKV